MLRVVLATRWLRVGGMSVGGVLAGRLRTRFLEGLRRVKARGLVGIRRRRERRSSSGLGRIFPSCSRVLGRAARRECPPAGSRAGSGHRPTSPYGRRATPRQRAARGRTCCLRWRSTCRAPPPAHRTTSCRPWSSTCPAQDRPRPPGASPRRTFTRPPPGRSPLPVPPRRAPTHLAAAGPYPVWPSPRQARAHPVGSRCLVWPSPRQARKRLAQDSRRKSAASPRPVLPRPAVASRCPALPSLRRGLTHLVAVSRCPVLASLLRVRMCLVQVSRWRVVGSPRPVPVHLVLGSRCLLRASLRQAPRRLALDKRRKVGSLRPVLLRLVVGSRCLVRASLRRVRARMEPGLRWWGRGLLRLVVLGWVLWGLLRVASGAVVGGVVMSRSGLLSVRLLGRGPGVARGRSWELGGPVGRMGGAEGRRGDRSRGRGCCMRCSVRRRSFWWSRWG